MTAASAVLGVGLLVGPLLILDATRQPVGIGSIWAEAGELVVRGPTDKGGIDAREVEKVMGISGVETAIPLVYDVVAVTDRWGRLKEPALVVGSDCRLVETVQGGGCTDAMLEAAGTEPLVVGGNFSPGDQVIVPGGAVAVTPTPGAPKVVGGRFVAFALPAAQDLLGRDGSFDVVVIRVLQSTDKADVANRLLQRLATSFHVDSTAEPDRSMSAALRDQTPVLVFVALLAPIVGTSLILSNLRTSIDLRRVELAVVAAIGGGPVTVVLPVLIEAVAVSATSFVFGLGLGILVAKYILSTMTELAPFADTAVLAIRWWIVAIAAMTAAIPAFMGAVVAAKQVADVRLTRELFGRTQEDDHQSPTLLCRAVQWLTLALVGVVGCLIAARDGGITRLGVPLGQASLAASCGFQLLAIRPAAPLVARSLARIGQSSAPLRLAAASLMARPSRSGVAALAIAAVLVIHLVVGGIVSAAKNEARNTALDNLDGVFVRSVGNRIGVQTTLSDHQLAALEDLVGSDNLARSTQLILNSATGPITVVAHEDPWLDVEIIAGDDSATESVESGMALVGVAAARYFNVRPTDTLRLPGSTEEVEVGAVVQTGFDPYTVQISYSDIERLFGSQLPTSVTISPLEGTTTDDLATLLLAEANDNSSALGQIEILDADSLAKDWIARSSERLAVLRATEQALVAVALAALAASFILLGMRWRDDVALIKAIGATRRLVLSTIILESGLLTAIGLGFGLGIGLAMQPLLRLMLPVLANISEQPTLNPGDLAREVLLVLGVVLTSSAVTTVHWLRAVPERRLL